MYNYSESEAGARFLMLRLLGGRLVGLLEGALLGLCGATRLTLLDLLPSLCLTREVGREVSLFSLCLSRSIRLSKDSTTLASSRDSTPATWAATLNTTSYDSGSVPVISLESNDRYFSPGIRGSSLLGTSVSASESFTRCRRDE